MFQRMLSALGVGGPSVDTVLDRPSAVPGEVLTGQVRIQGGSADATISQVALALVTRVDVEHGDHEARVPAEFLRFVVQERVVVPAGRLVTLPFALPLPFETPITAVGPTPLRGMTVGVRTDLVIAGAPDKGDLDPIAVHPLPSQERVLDAAGHLGLRFRSADVEAGRLYGVPQELSVYQELEFCPPAALAHRLSEIELTFVATPHELYVVLEADRRGGLFRSGGDTFGRFAMTHQEAMRADWAGLIGQWLDEVVHRRGTGYPGIGGHEHPMYVHPRQEHHGYPGHGGHGVGGALLGAAAGFAGGMLLGEVVEEFVDDAGDFFD